jgi:hypothetical protein
VRKMQGLWCLEVASRLVSETPYHAEVVSAPPLHPPGHLEVSSFTHQLILVRAMPLLLGALYEEAGGRLRPGWRAGWRAGWPRGLACV